MNDYDQEKWYDLYKTAMLGLDRCHTGRIGDARTEIASRLEILKQHPALHQHEYQAIQDALHNLLLLEKQEARLAAEDQKRLLEEATQKLQALAPKFQEPN